MMNLFRNLLFQSWIGNASNDRFNSAQCKLNLTSLSIVPLHLSKPRSSRQCISINRIFYLLRFEFNF